MHKNVSVKNLTVATVPQFLSGKENNITQTIKDYGFSDPHKIIVLLLLTEAFSSQFTNAVSLCCSSVGC